MLATLPKNVDEKMLVTLPKNVDENKCWQTSGKMLRKNDGNSLENIDEKCW
jgi:hypothetical protein